MSNQFIKIGNFVQQPEGFKSFIPADFPPLSSLPIGKDLAKKHTKAVNLLGELNGVTRLLPDRDCFLKMFVLKDATSSSQIEGTQATMADAIAAANIDRQPNLPNDVDDILHYLNAINYGLERLETYPLTINLIKELHSILLSDARTTHYASPGEFRHSQNWIGGSTPMDAKFVPPPAHELMRTLGDLEKFIHADDEFLPLVKAALIHAQFETIHPFLDGNGRTGRMLITLFLWLTGLLRIPVLYLSSYFRDHKQAYYDGLNRYREGNVYDWIEFFLDAVIDVAESAITICDKITELRERDMRKIQALNQQASESAIKALQGLFQMPKAGVADIASMVGITTRGAYKVIDRLVKLEILYPAKPGADVYGQKWVYRDYLALFEK